jgi:hypothetical protein
MGFNSDFHGDFMGFIGIINGSFQEHLMVIQWDKKWV